MSNNKYCIGPGYGDGIYLIRKLKIQDEILAFLEQIPVATGVGVAKDITDIEFFYSTVSGRDPEIKRFNRLDSEFALETYFNEKF